jgi:hypothetical protein
MVPKEYTGREWCRGRATPPPARRIEATEATEEPP